MINVSEVSLIRHLSVGSALVDLRPSLDGSFRDMRDGSLWRM